MDLAFCATLGVVAVILLLSLLWKFHTFDRSYQARITEVVAAIGGLKEALVTATTGQRAAPVETTEAAARPRATAAPSAAVVTDEGTIDLDPDVAARLFESAEMMHRGVPDILRDAIKAGIAAEERRAGIAETEDDEQTRILGPGERPSRGEAAGEPAFPELKGSEDESPTPPEGAQPESSSRPKK